MVPGAVALPGFYHNEPHSNQACWYFDGGRVPSFFGDGGSLFGSPGMTWSGHEFGFSSCRSMFHGPDFACSSPQLVYSADEDTVNILAGEDLQRFNQPEVIDALQSLNSPETPYFELNQYGCEEKEEQEEHERRVVQFLEQQLGLSPSSPQSDESGLSSLEVAFDSEEVFVKHEPPPLNNKRIERVEWIDDTVEAAEVSVDLIRNRRPFRCGQEGCDKTFKNAQTMKMHHKTHYTDGSAIGADGRPTLPTLGPSSCPGPSKKIPSRCPKCRKTFVGLYELRRHFGRKHSEGEKPFACRKCHKRFYIEVDVRDHEKLCGEPIECRCGLKFAFKCNLVAHKKAHPMCQETTSNHHSSSSSCNQSATTSDEDSSGRSSHGTKRHRTVYEEASTISSSPSSSSSSSFSSWSSGSNLPGVGLATPVYASRILSSLDNYYFSQFASSRATSSGLTAPRLA